MDFSASTDIHEIVNENDNVNEHIIIPRNTKESQKSSLFIESNQYNYNNAYYKSDVFNLTDEDFTGLNISFFNPKTRKIKNNSISYHQAIPQEQGRLRYSKIIESFELPKVINNSYIDDDSFCKLKRKNFRNIK